MASCFIMGGAGPRACLSHRHPLNTGNHRGVPDDPSGMFSERPGGLEAEALVGRLLAGRFLSRAFEVQRQARGAWPA